MSSNGKSTLSDDSTSEKPKGVKADSFPGSIKPIGTPYVSSSHSIGDPHSNQAKGKASVSSGLTKPSGKTAVSSGVSIGVPNSKNPNGHVNHSIFWKNLAPVNQRGGEQPKGALGGAIDTHFGSLEGLVKKMNVEGAALQGS